MEKELSHTKGYTDGDPSKDNVTIIRPTKYIYLAGAIQNNSKKSTNNSMK